MPGKDSLEQKEFKTTGFEMFKMLKFFKSKLLLIIALIFSIGCGVVPCLVNIFTGQFATNGSTDGFDIDAITPPILYMVYANVAGIVLQAIIMVIKVKCNPLFATEIRLKVYESLLNQPIDYFDRTSAGMLITRLSEDVVVVKETYVDKTCTFVQNLAQVVSGLVIAFTTNWLVSCCSLVAIPIVIIAFWVGKKCISDLFIKYNETSTSASAKAQEVITQFRTVKAFDGEMKEYDLYSKTLENVDHIFVSTAVATGLKDGIISFSTNGLTAAVLYFTSYVFMKKPEMNIEVGDLIIIMMSLMYSSMGVTQIFGPIDDFRKANVSARKLLEIIELDYTDSHKGEKLDNVEGKIEFKNVGFKYSTRDQYAVKDLSFTINAGETVALVGESGCGKTTTLQLLQRFYDVSEGEILVDGHNINALSPFYLRSQIASVPQTPVLFSMSIRDNIRYGTPDATETQVKEAAQIGNADSFIMDIDNNYDQEVQQSSLSGGQKQRICISRAILENTPILLLDEATAALDTESEQLVQQSLEKVRKGKTAIVVAHRLATVKHADRILVFANGKIVESGKHEELLEKGGIYADLVKYQLQ